MLPAEKRQGGKSAKRKGSRVRLILSSRVFIGTFMVLVLFGILITIIVQIPFLPREYQYQIGDRSVKTYVAPEKISYLDTIATEHARRDAAAAATDKYKVDNDKIKEIFDQLGSFFQEVETARRALDEIRNRPDGENVEGDVLTEDEIITQTVKSLEEHVAAVSGTDDYIGPDISILLALERGDYLWLRRLIETNLREELTRAPIHADELEARRALFRQALMVEEIQLDEAELLSFIGAAYMAGNALYDSLATEQARNAVREAVVPIYANLDKGEPYLKEGERISQTHFDVWTSLGMITETGEPERSTVATWMAAFLLVVVFLVMLLYLNRFFWVIVESLKTFALYLLINLITGVSGLLIGLFLFQGDVGIIHIIAVAVILNALMISQYFNNNLGLFNSILWAALFAAYFEPAVFFPAVLLAGLTCLLVRRDPSSKLLVLLVLLNILLAFFALAALELFSGGEGIEAFNVPNLWVALIVGVVPVAAVFFLNMLVDLSFNIPTASRLNEFANLNHPLLRKLQIEAPGTYHHSILVGSIAELAGSAVGANPLLIRVGALYHDIGKGQRPEFFAENQHKGTNIHDKYSPSLSKIIIENHVRDGVRLARRARLPQEIIDIIPEHHGTTLITYFFRKALAISDGDPVNEHDFRYPGPKPRSPEAAVIFLTDASESAARSLEEPTQHRIETAVDRIFEERLLDGQFNECGLTMNQLEAMKASIISSLAAAYHHRVAYPDEDEMKREIERDEQSEDEEG